MLARRPGEPSRALRFALVRATTPLVPSALDFRSRATVCIPLLLVSVNFGRIPPFESRAFGWPLGPDFKGGRDI